MSRRAASNPSTRRRVREDGVQAPPHLAAELGQFAGEALVVLGQGVDFGIQRTEPGIEGRRKLVEFGVDLGLEPAESPVNLTKSHIHPFELLIHPFELLIHPLELLIHPLCSSTRSNRLSNTRQRNVPNANTTVTVVALGMMTSGPMDCFSLR